MLGGVPLPVVHPLRPESALPVLEKAWMSDPPILEPMPTTRRRFTVADLDDDASSGADTGASNGRDVFISHATEDKKAVARPLAHALEELGITVWFDDFELRIGDSLRRSIADGIARSRFGLVILSKSFFDKGWTQYELNGLVVQANNDQKTLLVIWHEISKEYVIARDPSLADIVARSTSSRFDNRYRARDRLSHSQRTGNARHH